MPKIIDWLNDFIAGHEDRHPCDDWPEPDSPESRWRWSVWFDGLKDAKVTPGEALAASLEMVGSGPKHWEDHLPAILDAVRRRRERPATPGGLVLGTTVEERRQQTYALMDDLHDAGFHFEWDQPSNQFRCVPLEGPYRRPSDAHCERIRALARGLWTTLEVSRPISEGSTP